MRAAEVLAVFLLVAGEACAIGPPAPRPPLPTENQALAMARDDVKGVSSIDPLAAPFLRYVWIPEGSVEDAKCVSDTVNKLSRAPFIVRPQVIGTGRLVLCRIDLRQYAPRNQDLQDWIDTWEEFQFDPRFSKLITRDTLKLLSEADRELTVRRKVRSKERRLSKTTGKTRLVEIETEEDVLVVDAAKTDVVRLLGPHIDPAVWAELVSLTHSQTPVVSADYFFWRALSTVKDKGLFKQLYGGLYYEFLGLKTSKEGTDEDLFFQDHLGLGNVKQGVTAAKVYDTLRSDQRAAMFRSNVTGKPRRIDFGHGPQSRDSQGAWAVTHDLRDQDIDVGTHPIFNLLNFQDAAREVIYDKANGMHGYVLFDGNGKIQREAPPDVVVDHEIPSPFTRRLQGAISCIRCHEVKAEDGWKAFSNDARTLLPRLLGDTSGHNDEDSYSRIRGLYGADQLSVDKWLRRGREDYAQSTLRATGPWKDTKKANADVIQLTAKRTVARYESHVYGLVDARRALRDFGAEIDDPKAAVALLQRLLPPDEDAAVEYGHVAEDPRILALNHGLSINRAEYDQVYGFIAPRVQKSLAKMKGKP